MTIQEFLKNNDACQPAIDWVRNKTLSQSWEDCQDPQWMLWLLGRTGATPRQFALLAGLFANEVRYLMQPASIAAVDAAIEYGRGGNAPSKEIINAAAGSAAGSAARAAAAARAASDAAYAAAYAARAAADAAAWAAAAAAWAASARDAAARAAAAAAARDAWDAASRDAASARQCQIIRGNVPMPKI